MGIQESKDALFDGHRAITDVMGEITEITNILARRLLAVRSKLRAVSVTENQDELKVKVGEMANLLMMVEETVNLVDERLLSESGTVISCIADAVRHLADVQNLPEHPISDPKVRAHVFSLTEGKCAYCDVTLVNGGGEAEQFCVEHVVPVSKGGPNNIVNYVPSCRSCNNSKKDGHVLLFIRRNLPRRQEAQPAATVIPMQQRSW